MKVAETNGEFCCVLASLLFGPSIGEMGNNYVDHTLALHAQRRKWRLAKRRWRAKTRTEP